MDESFGPEAARELPASPPLAWWRRPWARLLLAFGPGLMVMLADTDVGSVVTAAQSGTQWGYTMILPQLFLIPILYLVQEVTVRLGLVTRQGHGELIRQHFGFGWALLSVSTLFLSAVGALITEFSGIAGVGTLWGIPPWASVGTATLALIALGVSGRYRRVEAIGITIGGLEVLYLLVAVLTRPQPAQMAAGMGTVPLGNPSYVWLLAANVGAVIMPWMVFYQQGTIETASLDSPAQFSGWTKSQVLRAVKRYGYRTSAGGDLVFDVPLGAPVILEVMTSSTSGGDKNRGTTIGQVFRKAVLGREHQGPNINYRQVWARMVSQLITKSQVSLAWGGSTVWLLQDVLLDYIRQTTGLNVRPSGNGTVSGQVNMIAFRYRKGGHDLKYLEFLSAPVRAISPPPNAQEFVSIVDAPFVPAFKEFVFSTKIFKEKPRLLLQPVGDGGGEFEVVDQ